MLDTSDPIIEVGGKASVLEDRLLDCEYTRLSVLDISTSALAVTKRRLGVRTEAVQWIEADTTIDKPAMKCALWHDRAVFRFLTNSEGRKGYVAALKQGLKIGGHLILASFAIGGPETCSGLPIVQYDAAKLISELGPGFQLIEGRTESHRTPAHRVQAFAYFHLARTAESHKG